MAEKIIGILGGMGPEATLFLFKKILENTPASKDQEHLRVIIDNNPKIPERLPAIMGLGASPVPMMAESGLALKRAGVDFIVIPCISAHFFLEELRKKLDMRIISIVDETAKEVARQQPKIKAVGLLAAEGAIHGGMFQERFAGDGIKTLVPSERSLEQLMSVIFRIKETSAGHDREKIKDEIVGLSNRLIKEGAEGIVAGCTELSVVIHPEDISVPVFDALNVLARAAIKEAGVTPR